MGLGDHDACGCGTAREDWIVFLPGLLPAYISIGQYEKNRKRMEANRSRSQSMGAVRGGPALLAGLVACGRCGASMTVHYQRPGTPHHLRPRRQTRAPHTPGPGHPTGAPSASW